MGLVRPVIACATNGGVSVIHPSGDVYDVYGSQTHLDRDHVFFTDDGKIGQSFEASGVTSNTFGVSIDPIPFADDPVGTSANWGVEKYNPPISASLYGLITNTNNYDNSNAVVNAVTPMSNNGLAIGYPDRLSIVKRNTGNGDEGAVAYITSSYNTGYMVGGIRGAFLANSLTVDRSVKANAIVATGSPSLYTVATGAELQGVDLDGSSQYLRQAYNADLNFGTAGDFCYTTWIKVDTNVAGYIVDRSDTDGSNRAFWHTFASGSNVVIKSNIGSNGTTVVTLDTWTQVVMMRRSGKGYIYINGVEDAASGTVNAYDLTSSDSTATLSVGVQYTSNNHLNGKLALFRISATAPTPKQIADIYAAEKPLFAANAKCLLDTTSVVNDLAYDKSSGLLYSADGLTRGDVFRGLERVDTIDSATIGHSSAATTLEKLSAAGGVLAGSSAANAGVNLPSIDVRADLNEGATTLPDDGKLHFEASIYGATATSIGTIPLGINERYTVTATIVGEEYNVDSGNWISVTTTRTYQRDLGSLGHQPVSYKLSDESLASMDAVLTADANNILVWVTGVAGKQIVWKASVEVQRISDKTYER